MSVGALRIAMLCESFDRLGGVAQIVEELAAELANAGHQVAIVSNPQGEGTIARLTNSAVEQIRLDLPRTKPPSLRHPARLFARPRASELLKFLRIWKPDVLNIHGGLRDRFPTVLQAAREAELPLVQSIHLVPESDPRHALAALCGARAVTFPSVAVKSAFERLSPSTSKAHVVIGGANIEAALRAAAYRRARPYIFCASRLDLRHKAVDDLIRAFSIIAMQCTELDLLIAGDGPDRERIQVLIEELELGNRIELLLARPHDEIWGLHKGAALFVMLSRMGEGLPLVFFEAMACSVAVIGTRIGGNPELIIDRQTGLLVDNNDIAEVAASMQLLLTDANLRTALARNGQDLVTNSYSWRSAAQRFAALYRECIS